MGLTRLVRVGRTHSDMRQGRIALGLGVAVVAIGATAIVPVGATGGGGPVAQQLLGSGSDTTQFMMNSLDRLYQFSQGCDQIPNPSGPTAWLDLSCQAPDHVVASQSGTSTSGHATVTMPNTAGVVVGMLVTGPGIPTPQVGKADYVGKVNANTSIVLSNSPTVNQPIAAGAGSGAGTFNFSSITYSENYGHDILSEAYFLGSSAGILQMCDQGQAGVAHIDFARSSRAPVLPPNSSPDCAGLDFVAYARDAITWEAFNISGSGVSQMQVSPGNVSGGCNGTSSGPAICLTQAQLQGIFVNCSITDWDQVDGNPNVSVPISIYTDQPASGTRKTFDKFLGGSSSSCIPAAQQATHIIPENSNSGIPVSDEAGAIYPFSFGVWTLNVHGQGNAVLGAIDGVVANATTISNLTFPYGRFLYNVYCKGGVSGGCTPDSNTARHDAAVNYVGPTGWICKGAAQHAKNAFSNHFYRQDIQSAISANGFVPEALGVIGGGVGGSDYCRNFTT